MQAFIAFVLMAAMHSGLDARVVAAVIQAESEWDAGAIGPAGEVGLMQIMPQEAGDAFSDRPTTEELLDPEINLRTGCAILSANLRYFDGDLQKALVAYNMGIGGLGRRGMDDPAAVRYLTRFVGAWYELWPGDPLPWEVKHAQTMDGTGAADSAGDTAGGMYHLSPMP